MVSGVVVIVTVVVVMVTVTEIVVVVESPRTDIGNAHIQTQRIPTNRLSECPQTQ